MEAFGDLAYVGHAGAWSLGELSPEFEEQLPGDRGFSAAADMAMSHNTCMVRLVTDQGHFRDLLLASSETPLPLHTFPLC